MSTFEFSVQLPLEHFELDVACSSDARALGLFGPSGSGKSSLVECLVGWRAPRSGRIAIGGEVWFDSSARRALAPAARRAGYVPQDLLLFPHLDVEDNVRFGAGQASADVERALEVLELGPLRGREIGTLSGGERQRVALARAVCARPRVLMLDEPLGALDRALRRKILPYLLRVLDEFAVPLVLVSHDPTEITAACEHVLVLARGRVAAAGPPSEVLADAELLGGDVDEFENVLRGRVASVGETTARVRLGDTLLEVPRAALREGELALICARSGDVLIATERPRGLSARNVLEARIDRIESLQHSARVRARIAGAGPSLLVELTPLAVGELGLCEGREVFLVIKTRSLRVLGAER